MLPYCPVVNDNAEQSNVLESRSYNAPTDDTNLEKRSPQYGGNGYQQQNGDTPYVWFTSGFFKDPSFDQSRAHGTRYLMLARMDALWTARKAIQIGILVDTHPFSVDHCILCDQQLLSTSIAHLVVECEQVLAIAFSLD
ncbi:hypothetical protein BASA62_006964 [Batrachochytrium salamandrivorans]|nr:hypothetical protein BASA62_006964 [Batrachochytrium salamandrivorans]